MNEELLKQLTKEVKDTLRGKELNDECKKYLTEWLKGESPTHVTAWTIIDELGLERRGNRAELRKCLNDFATKHNINVKDS